MSTVSDIEQRRALQRYPRGERNEPDEYRRVVRVTRKDDYGPADDGAPGSVHCPHCGSWGRYIYFFTTDDGQQHAAMAGCIEIWPGGKAAVAAFKRVEKRLDQVADNAKEHGLDIAGCYDAEARVLEQFQVGLLGEMLDKAARYDISAKQADLIRRLFDDLEGASAREAERRAEKAKREAERANAAPVPTGQGIVIEGTIVKRYWQENDFGGSLRMIVQGDDGWRVWGTLPTSLYSQDFRDPDGNVIGTTAGADEGDRVRFVANVTASDDDPTFGFCKRPRKASIITD